MELKKLTLQPNKTSPFIGHAGVGARIEIVGKVNNLVLRETTRSQLILIFTLGILSIYPAWILVFEANRINGGIFGKFILCIPVIISFPFFVRYITRFLSQRRIEVDQSKQQIRFISENKKIDQTIHFSEIQSIEIKDSDYRSDGHSIKNYTLVLSDKTSKAHELCTSDQEKNILAVYKKIVRFFPNIIGSSSIND